MQGRYLINETSKIAEERFPVKVIYGDTDSVLLLPHGKTSTIASAWKLGSIIAETCTDLFPDPVILEMEKNMLPVRTESQKRYITMVHESPDDHGHFDAKGVDIARRAMPFGTGTFTPKRCAKFARLRHSHARASLTT